VSWNRSGTVGASILLALAAGAQAQGGADSIRAEDLRRTVKFLAADSLLGRETGEPGAHKAERFIAKEFKRSGLSPLPGYEDYFLDFTLYRQTYDPAGTGLGVTLGGRSKKNRLGTAFRPFSFSDEGSVEAPLVFAGYGITADEYEYDDYAGIDVEGKIVLILRHEPGEDDPDSPFDGTDTTSYSQFTSKAANAGEHGALGMLLVTDPLNHEPDEDLRVGGALRLEPPESASESDEPDQPEEEEPFLAMQISQQLASTIVSSSGRSLAELQRAVDSGSSPAELSLNDVVVQMGVLRSEKPDPVAARNVVAFLEGRDPELKDQWVVVGGHHDHVGGYRGRGDTVFNGADDNASGTSGVIALARAFSERPERPRRSIVFVTFSGEEKGLLGSRAMVRQELIPIDRVVFMLNLDMIGRNPDRDIEINGDGFVRGLQEIVEEANRDRELSLEFGGTAYAGNSDHDAFYEMDIPFMFFFTGLHEDYHQLGDHPEKLDYERMESILSVAYGTLDRVAEIDEPLGFIHHINWLGTQIEVLEQGAGPHAVVTAVDEDSRATEAGIQAGDVLVAFDDAILEDPEQVGERFREIDPGTRVALGLRRDDDELVVEIERAKTGYLGVFPGPLDDDRRKAHGLGDSEGLVLNRVMTDGPAGQAGLQQGDILLRISGRPVGLTNLRQRLMQIGAGETVDATIIRDGERLTLPLTLGERPQRP
jgi:hypothetical protein